MNHTSAILPRPVTLAAVSRQTLASPENLRISRAAGHIKEFRDVLRARLADAPDGAEKGRIVMTAIFEPPPVLDLLIYDAYLAAIAETLAHAVGQASPAWTEDPERFLLEPVFSGGLAMRQAVLRDTPGPFRRRMLFLGPDRFGGLLRGDA
jgi:hypothetical protein